MSVCYRMFQKGQQALYHQKIRDRCLLWYNMSPSPLSGVLRYMTGEWWGNSGLLLTHPSEQITENVIFAIFFPHDYITKRDTSRWMPSL